MKNIQKIETVLARMAELLRIGEDYDRANVFDKLRAQIAIEPDETAHRIRISYGGMGSLNDIVLHKNGQPLTTENDEFDALSTELYRLCHEISPLCPQHPGRDL